MAKAKCVHLVHNYAVSKGYEVPCEAAGSRSKNSATNQKRAYGVGTDLVRTGYARIRPGILWGRTHDVRS